MWLRKKLLFVSFSTCVLMNSVSVQGLTAFPSTYQIGGPNKIVGKLTLGANLRIAWSHMGTLNTQIMSLCPPQVNLDLRKYKRRCFILIKVGSCVLNGSHHWQGWIRGVAWIKCGNGYGRLLGLHIHNSLVVCSLLQGDSRSHQPLWRRGLARTSGAFLLDLGCLWCLTLMLSSLFRVNSEFQLNWPSF